MLVESWISIAIKIIHLDLDFRLKTEATKESCYRQFNLVRYSRVFKHIHNQQSSFVFFSVLKLQILWFFHSTHYRQWVTHVTRIAQVSSTLHRVNVWGGKEENLNSTSEFPRKRFSSSSFKQKSIEIFLIQAQVANVNLRLLIARKLTRAS